MKKEIGKPAGFKVVPSGEERCIWMEAGVIDYKLCNNYFNCHTCAFDKAMKETADRNADARRLGIEAEGKKAGLEKLVDFLRVGPPLARVEGMEVEWAEYTGKYSEFTIRR